MNLCITPKTQDYIQQNDQVMKRIGSSQKRSKPNYHRSLLQLESYIQDSMKQDMIQIQQTAVHNHTATMIEIGTNLLSQTAEQTRKLTNVEAQVKLHILFIPQKQK